MLLRRTANNGRMTNIIQSHGTCTSRRVSGCLILVSCCSFYACITYVKLDICEVSVLSACPVANNWRSIWKRFGLCLHSASAAVESTLACRIRCKSTCYFRTMWGKIAIRVSCLFTLACLSHLKFLARVTQHRGHPHPPPPKFIQVLHSAPTQWPEVHPKQRSHIQY